MDEIKRVTPKLSQFGISYLQLWIDYSVSFDFCINITSSSTMLQTNGTAGLWSQREDGVVVNLGTAKAYDLFGPVLLNRSESALQLFPTSPNWAELKHVVQSLETSLLPVNINRWKCIHVVSTPGPYLTEISQSTSSNVSAYHIPKGRGVFVAVDEFSTETVGIRMKTLLGKQVVEKLAVAVGLRLREISDKQERIQQTFLHRDAEITLALDKVKQDLLRASNYYQIALIVAAAGVEVFRADYCWVILTFDRADHQDSATEPCNIIVRGHKIMHKASLEGGLEGGRSGLLGASSSSPVSPLLSPRSSLGQSKGIRKCPPSEVLSSIIDSTNTSQRDKPNIMNFSFEDIAASELGGLDASGRNPNTLKLLRVQFRRTFLCTVVTAMPSESANRSIFDKSDDVPQSALDAELLLEKMKVLGDAAADAFDGLDSTVSQQIAGDVKEAVFLLLSCLSRDDTHEGIALCCIYYSTERSSHCQY